MASEPGINGFIGKGYEDRWKIIINISLCK